MYKKNIGKKKKKKNEQMLDLPDGRKVRMNGNNPHIPWDWEISWIC